MENKELIQTERQLANTRIDVEMVKQLYHLNHLTPFPVSDNILERWSASIQELEPEITPEVIKWICNNMKIGWIEYDNRKGIQNVFIGFRSWIKEHQEILGKEKYKTLYDKYKKGATFPVKEISADEVFGKR